MVCGGVFISYRGEDSYSYGALLHAELSRCFGPELVFLDSASIPAGADFVEHLLDRVRRARVVLSVIGTRWLAATGPNGGRRIDDPADWIRRELVAAFAAGVRVVPVVTDGAQMPTEADLPGELAALGRCQFRRLRHRDAEADLARLVAELADLDPELGAATAARPSTAGWPVPNQLPAATGCFTGRQEELARLLQPHEGIARTLVVSAVDGMAGIGKTALAVLAAHRLTEAGRYPDGSLFVDLHGYSGRAPTDPAAALETLLRGLGVPGPQIPPGLEARVGLYRSVLARRRVLVVLDNARDETQVRPLLPGTPGCLVIVTSRRRMAGLDDADHLTLDILPVEDAVRLFRAVAGPGCDPGDEQTIEAIVRSCGLLPLAVRIAAARLRASRTWTGPTLLGKLQATQGRLAELDDGERSVAAAFAVSFQQLPADQQDAFAVLGVHPGVEYEPYATAALLDSSAAHAGRLLDGLEQVNLLDQPTPGRYRFHDLVRAYATTAGTRTATDRRAALNRLFDHYAHATTHAAGLAYPYDADHLPRPTQPATTATPHLPDEAAAVAWLDAELANLLATARHATAHRPGHTTHQSATLHRHLRTRGRHTDAHTLHQHALTAARTTRDHDAQTTALTNLGYIHRLQGRYGPAADCYTQALQAAQATGNRTGELNALNGLGWAHHAQGRYGPAADCYTEALQTARATGHRTCELAALTGLGRVHYMQGRYGPAADCLTQAFEKARATSNRACELTALTGLGWVHHVQRRHGPAADCYTQALRTARATGNRTGELDALTGLGHIHNAQGRYDLAADCYTQAVEAARATGNRTGELNALTGLGHIHRRQGRYGAAADCYTRVLELAREIGNRNWQLEGHLGLGRTHHATGHPEQALTAYQQALTLACDLDQPPDQARAHDGLAHAHHTLGHPDQARQYWQHALHILTVLDTFIADDVTATDIRARLTALDSPTSPPLPA
ncbi:MAG TPA: tetratricopeptide repeat protein [Mycobacteriales bacterium]|nr:tetratricopeptide repeat protein [Mycobacteriales bacterium]